LGYAKQSDTQILLTEKNDEPSWQDGKVCYSLLYDAGLPVFNEEVALEIRVSDEQHRKRESSTASV
jgi:hypothetical protein